MNTFKLLGIDPGNNVGVAIYTIDAKTLEIIAIETRLFILENHIDNLAIDKIPLKVLALNNIVNELLVKHDPLIVGFELAFLNMRFPKAVMQLAQYTSIIEYTFRLDNPFIKFFKYPPKYIKASVGAGGNADKNDMMKAIKKIPEITKYILPEYRSEHEIDALSIGYTALNEIRKYPHILYAVF